jgi:chromosome segregation ATPase
VDTEAAESRKGLQEERDRGSRLEQDLAAARRDVEAQTALAAKSSAAASQMKKTADNVADLRKALQQERDRGSRLEQDLAAARRDVETQTALAAKASAEANQLKTADAGAADLRKALQQERDHANRLEQDLAAARRAVEMQPAPAAKANDEAARPRQATESGSAGPRQSLQQDPDRATQLMHDLVLARSHAPAPSIIAADQINTQQRLEAARPVAAEQAAVADPQSETEDTAEVTKLVAYARVLLGRGDIGSARTVLQRAVEMGSAQAIFTLAETYDPLILSKWGTYGTRGDATRALDYYARALAGGIQEAKERSDALNR